MVGVRFNIHVIKIFPSRWQSSHTAQMSSHQLSFKFIIQKNLGVNPTIFLHPEFATQSPIHKAYRISHNTRVLSSHGNSNFAEDGSNWQIFPMELRPFIILSVQLLFSVLLIFKNFIYLG